MVFSWMVTNRDGTLAPDDPLPTTHNRIISHTQTLTPPPGVKSGGVVGGARSPAGLRRPPAEGASVECEAGRGGRSVGVGGVG